MHLRNSEEEYLRVELCCEGKSGETVDMEALSPVANLFACVGEGEGLLEVFKLLKLEVSGTTLMEQADELEVALIRAGDILGAGTKVVDWGSAESAELEQVVGKVRERQC